jgi:hypothetical protein
MRANRCLPALALLLFLPARADDGPAVKAPAQADVKKNQEQMSCCAGEEKVKCPRAKAAASSKKPATKTAPAAAAATAKPAAAGAANMVVTRDPETGELRNATAAEREKLLGRRPLATPEHKVVTLPDGSVMVELGEADMSYAVAKRNADGTISQTCVHGDAAAAKAVASPASVPAAPATPADR